MVLYYGEGSSAPRDNCSTPFFQADFHLIRKSNMHNDNGVGVQQIKLHQNQSYIFLLVCSGGSALCFLLKSLAGSQFLTYSRCVWEALSRTSTCGNRVPDALPRVQVPNHMLRIRILDEYRVPVVLLRSSAITVFSAHCCLGTTNSRVKTLTLGCNSSLFTNIKSAACLA